ncbi:MAG TPA: DUF433 domain-containing protein [Phycisphaerales bacterium]|nr:DUF433 domain-containing protein [Phycisphaerales bacterium]
MESPIKVDPEIMHGTPCFAGTRVPVEALFDYLEDGRTTAFFLEQYPSVTMEQVQAVLRMARDIIPAPATRRAAG